jgi:competence protein ComFC
MVVDFFFPRRCVGCGRTGDFLCADCFRKLPRLLPPLCNKCGKPESSGGLCPTCWSHQTEIDGIRSPFRFDGVIRQAVHDLKYHNLKAVSRCLAELMADYLQANPVSGDVLVPVPLHARRLRERGYNQSSLLAKELGELTGFPVAEDALFRSKDSLSQARTTNVEDRRRNVAGVFTCRGMLKGSHVLLIDDVCTSGATLEACAVALKAASAVSVWGLTLAREV